MTKEELQKIIAIDEGFRIELTTSTGNMDKFQEAICAFANDMPGSGKKGYLLIGVYDDGTISGMKVDDALMKRISGIRSDGNILPLPVMTTEKVQTEWGGRFILKNDSFQTMTLTHPSYLTRVIEQKEGVPDTIFLLPSGQQLAEVVVIGHAPKPAITAEDVRKYAAENYTPSGSSGVSFDFFDLIDFKGRKHKKRAKKMKEIMEDY